MKDKLNCKDCKQKCCEGYLSVNDNKNKDLIILLPLSRKKIKVDGIPLKRITDRIWGCEWFNKKTGKCKNYKKRPKLCRYWFCKGHEKKPTKACGEDGPFTLAFSARLIKRRF